MNPENSGILTINGGSSSIKFALYQAGEPLKRGLYGKIDRIGIERDESDVRRPGHESA